ncbi:MAG: GH32 C-terminal domain-containing protein [Pirellulales bacterium]
MRHRHWVAAWALFCGLLLLGRTAPALADDDRVLADFEGPDYGDWKATGEAFGAGPARGALPGQMPVDGFLGQGLVNSFVGGDRTTGTLTSPPFRLDRKYVQFLIGGGKHPGQTEIRLLVDGQAVRTATGPNDKPGGTERLEAAQWDVAELRGREAVLQIVDSATGGWGHINIDQIVLTDRRLPGFVDQARRELQVDQRYLLLPVKTGGPKRRVKLEVDGRTVREFEIELADGEADFRAFVDLADWQGKSAAVIVDRLPETSRALTAVETSPQPVDPLTVYREPLRPQVHFSARVGWLNDPNGLVYHEGEWHLFFQHNPYGWHWGNMHWGHAVSRDLVHWEELPIAVYPRQFGDWAFSGSAVVDKDNASGFGAAGESPLVAAYTSTGRGECMLFSRDRGRTWTEFAGNPVVKHPGRDPRLFWHAATKKWVMAVYDESGPQATRQIAFLTSPDLKKWEFTSRILDFYECPDIYELPVEGRAGETRWVLSGADSNYLVGQFDGQKFTHQGQKQRGNYGNCFYAAQTFSDAPDGRRVILGWLQAASPGMPFNQCMSTPCELRLRDAADGPQLVWKPVAEFNSLRLEPRQAADVVVDPGRPLTLDDLGDVLDLELTVRPNQAAAVTLEVRGVSLKLDAVMRQLAALDRTAPLRLEKEVFHFRVICDRTTVEVFADDCAVYMPLAVIPARDRRSVRVLADGGAARVDRLTVYPLRSAWSKP